MPFLVHLEKKNMCTAKSTRVFEQIQGGSTLTPMQIVCTGYKRVKKMNYDRGTSFTVFHLLGSNHNVPWCSREVWGRILEKHIVELVAQGPRGH